MRDDLTTNITFRIAVAITQAPSGIHHPDPALSRSSGFG